MKTLKHITLLSGIIVGLLIIFSQTLQADSKEQNAADNQQKTTFNMNHQQLQDIEYKLIENYLKENPVEATEKYVYIYTVDGNCVFKGEKENATDLIRKSDVLFERGNNTYYITIQ